MRMKKINKSVLIFGITLLLLCVGLSGCIDGNSDQDSVDFQKFIGTWVCEDEDAMYLFGDVVTFFSNGSIRVGTSDHEGTFEIIDGKMYVTFTDYENNPDGREYSFSNNDQEFSIIDSFWEKTVVYTKIITDDSSDTNGDNNVSHNDTNVNYTVPDALTSLIYDEAKLSVYNISFETWGYNGSEGEKIADDIVKIPAYYEKGFYSLMCTVKNKAGFEIIKLEADADLLDENELKITAWGGAVIYVNICSGCTQLLRWGSYIWSEDFDRADHAALNITIF